MYTHAHRKGKLQVSVVVKPCQPRYFAITTPADKHHKLVLPFALQNAWYFLSKSTQGQETPVGQCCLVGRATQELKSVWCPVMCVIFCVWKTLQATYVGLHSLL